MNLSPVLKQRFFDANGLPLAGGSLYSYAAGTSTPQATYSNSTGTTNTNPVVLDASGYADVWLDPNLSYKFVLKDSGGVTLWTEDAVGFLLGVAKWNAGFTYQQGDIVSDASGQGLLYVSLTGNNVGNALTTVSAWRVFSGNVRTVSSNQTSPTLLVTDDLVRSNSTAGALTHTLPPSATTPIGKRITVKDVGTGGNTTAVKGSGTDNVDGANTWSTSLRANESSTFENNGTSWDVLNFGLTDGSVSTAKLGANSVTQAKLGAVNSAVSSSCGNFSTTAGTATAVTNLSASITPVTGRPICVEMISDGSGSGSQIFASNASGFVNAWLQVYRGATMIADMTLTTSASNDISLSQGGNISFTDTGASVGVSTTYAVKVFTVGGTIKVLYYKLYLREV